MIYIRHLLVQVRSLISVVTKRGPEGKKWYKFLTSVASCSEELSQLGLVQEEVYLVRDTILDGNEVAHKVEVSKIQRAIKAVRLEHKRDILMHLFDIVYAEDVDGYRWST